MKKSLLRIFAIILLGIVIVFAIRFSTPEDTWICQDGQRITHGKPSATIPTEPCVGAATGTIQATGIDLTNCVSYFDGCNNCSVKDGKADACTLMYCETPSEPKCLEYTTGSENTGLTDSTTMTNDNTRTPQAESNVNMFFKNYHEPINIMFKNVLIKNKLDFIVIPNHNKTVINGTGNAAMDIDGGYRFTLYDKESVCEILKVLGRTDLSCYDTENGANIYIEFKIIDSNYVKLQVLHYVGMNQTNLINKTYKRSELM